MSWLFGLNKNQGIPDLPPQFPSPPSGDGGKPGDSAEQSSDVSSQQVGSKMDAYRFDSSALERAAQAAKQLENSSE